MTPEREQHRTIDDCGKIRADCRKSQANALRWMFGIVLTVALGALGSAWAFSLQKTEVDTMQTTNITRNRESLDRIEEKLDKILDRLPQSK